MKAYMSLVGDEDSVYVYCAMLQCNLQDVISDKLVNKCTMDEVETIIYNYLQPYTEMPTVTIDFNMEKE